MTRRTPFTSPQGIGSLVLPFLVQELGYWMTQWGWLPTGNFIPVFGGVMDVTSLVTLWVAPILAGLSCLLTLPLGALPRVLIGIGYSAGMLVLLTAFHLCLHCPSF